MNDQLQSSIITISAVEITNWGLKIKDERGLIYNVSQLKQDGTETIAYKTITSLPKNGMGMTKGFKFSVVPNKQGGISRYVRIVEDPSNEALQATAGSPRGLNGTSAINTTNQKEVVNWDKISWGKCKHAYLVEAFKRGMDNCEQTERLAEGWADASMRKLGQPEFKDLGNGEEIDQIPFSDEEMGNTNPF